MSVGVTDFSSSTHQVLQVLPGDPGGEVLDDDPVLGPLRGAVLVHPWGTASALSVPAPVPPGPSGKLAGYPFSHEAATVHVVHSLVGIPVIIELHEPVPSLDQDVPEPSKVLELFLQVPLTTVLWQVANIYPCSSRHRQLCLL